MTLSREDGEYLLRANGDRLMTSSLYVSEQSLAQEALARVDGKRVLIGGLGMGFTLRSALDSLPEDAEVVVAELVSEVVEWNREYLGKLNNHPLRDPRASVVVGDVAKLLDGKQQWDAILLDVDNGATAFTKQDNQSLYETDGIEKLKNCLNPNGILAVWSFGQNRGFERRLKRAGFRVETVRVKEIRGKTKYYHYLFIARVNPNTEDGA